MSVRISLVFPLEQERGMTADALAAWTRQTMPADRFELIVVADAAAAIDPHLQSLLRPQDRVLRGTYTGISQQFDAGVRAGRGEYLFLTESHCMPNRDCLEKIDRYLIAHPERAGACCESVPAWNNAYQRIDATTFEEGFRHFVQNDDWRKLSVHGMALRRDVYLALGGLQHQYGRFSEMILAAALRDAGHQLGYARESVVTHHYRDTLQELIDGTDEYVRDECNYRAANPGPDWVGFSYLPDMPNPYSPGAAALDRAGCRAARSRIQKHKGASRVLYATARIVARLLGLAGPYWPSGWRSPRAGCGAGGTVTMWPLLIIRTAIWAVRSRLGQVRCLAALPAVDPPLPAPSESLAVDAFPDWAPAASTVSRG